MKSMILAIRMQRYLQVLWALLRTFAKQTHGWVTVLLRSLSSSSDFPQEKGHSTLAANILHGPTWPTRLPWTGHTMRHPLPAHFYCHSPPGPHEDGEIPGGDGEIETPPGIHHPNTSTLGEERSTRTKFSLNLD